MSRLRPQICLSIDPVDVVAKQVPKSTRWHQILQPKEPNEKQFVFIVFPCCFVSANVVFFSEIIIFVVGLTIGTHFLFFIYSEPATSSEIDFQFKFKLGETMCWYVCCVCFVNALITPPNKNNIDEIHLLAGVQVFYRL